MKFRIEITHLQNKDAFGENIIYQTAGIPQYPNAIKASLGNDIGAYDQNNPSTASWIKVNDNEVYGLSELDIEWKSKTEFSQEIEDGSNYKLGTGSSIGFKKGTNAGDYIWQWLQNDINANENCIAVKIIPIECDTINLIFIIKSIAQKWCNDDCVFECDLTENQEAINCFMRTLITDRNRANGNIVHTFDEWSNTANRPNNLHPKYLYCDEQPEWMLNVVFLIIFILFYPFLVIENIINAIIDGINSVSGLLGLSFNHITIISDISSLIVDNIAGCRRQHPSPYVRTYFQNVCDKCGLTYNVGYDLFNSPVLNWQMNDGHDPIFQGNNPYYYTTISTPFSRKGSLINNGVDVNYINQNDPQITANYLADKLKQPFNAQWRIFGNEFCLYQKNNSPVSVDVFDFVNNAIDKQYLLTNQYCFEWDTEQQPAYIRGVWAQTDAKDSSVDKVYSGWNNIVEWNRNRSANRSGEKSLISDYFAPTSFRYDGYENDYLVQALYTTNALLSTITFNMLGTLVSQLTAQFIQNTPLHAILLSGDKTEFARLIIHGNANINEAESCYVSASDPTMMVQDTFYNTTKDYAGTSNVLQTKYTQINTNNEPFSNYDLMTLPQRPGGANWVYSHPLHFDADFKYTLYHNLHRYDDPYLNPVQPIKTTIKIKLCCNTMIALGLDNTNIIKLGGKVKLPVTNNIAGFIEFFIWNIKLNNKDGSIELQLKNKKYI